MNLAFDDPTLEWSPTWTRIDSSIRVASWESERGRQFELDRTDAGHATVRVNDPDGDLDPTNSGSPYFGKIEPLIQCVLCRYNPVDATWHQRFRGFVEDWDYRFDPSQQVNYLTMSLTDIFEVLSSVLMFPGEFGDTPPAGYEGEVFFDENTMDGRIEQTLTNAGIPDDFAIVFSGNVQVYETLYSAGESAMTAIQEAADAEFPGVSNVYTDRYGRLAVHGRLAKFDPSSTSASAAYDAWSGATAYIAGDRVMSGGKAYECILGHTNQIPPNVTYWIEIPEKWDFNHWDAGDGEAVAAAPSTTAHIRRFAFNRGLSKIINSALAYPHRAGATLDGTDLAAQVNSDPTSIATYGIRSWSAPNLITKEGLLDSATDLEETFKFSEYYVANYSLPRNRITDIAFRSMATGQTGATANWSFLSKVDIGDLVDVTIDSPGGGGFTGDSFFVEGIRESSEPMNGGMDNDTVTLDLSPQAYFTDNPFPTP